MVWGMFHFFTNFLHGAVNQFRCEAGTADCIATDDRASEKMLEKRTELANHLGAQPGFASIIYIPQIMLPTGAFQELVDHKPIQTDFA